MKHYNRWHKWGDPMRVAYPRGDGRSYTQSHIRVHRLRGRAVEHQCQHCDRQAAEWAYDHADPDALTSAKGQAYSLDPEHYLPLCRSCHRKFDGVTPQWKAAS
jgi:hypothetical protein